MNYQAKDQKSYIKTSINVILKDINSIYTML